MAVLQDWVLPSKRLIAIAQAADVDTSTLEIEPFVWSPNEKPPCKAYAMRRMLKAHQEHTP